MMVCWRLSLSVSCIYHTSITQSLPNVLRQSFVRYSTNIWSKRFLVVERSVEIFTINGSVLLYIEKDVTIKRLVLLYIEYDSKVQHCFRIKRYYRRCIVTKYRIICYFGMQLVFHTTYRIKCVIMEQYVTIDNLVLLYNKMLLWKTVRFSHTATYLCNSIIDCLFCSPLPELAY